MAKKKVVDVQVVVTSRMKDVIRDMGLRSDGGLSEAVNQAVVKMLTAAGERTKANSRSTVRPCDL